MLLNSHFAQCSYLSLKVRCVHNWLAVSSWHCVNGSLETYIPIELLLLVLGEESECVNQVVVYNIKNFLGWNALKAKVALQKLCWCVIVLFCYFLHFIKFLWELLQKKKKRKQSQNVYFLFDLTHIAEMNDFRAKFMSVVWLIVI